MLGFRRLRRSLYRRLRRGSYRRLRRGSFAWVHGRQSRRLRLSSRRRLHRRAVKRLRRTSFRRRLYRVLKEAACEGGARAGCVGGHVGGESTRGSKGARGRETGVREIEKRGPGVREGRTRGHWGFLRGGRKRTQGTGDPETHAAGAHAPSTQEPGKLETPSPRARGTQAPRDPARPRDPEAGKQGGKRPGTHGRGHPGRQGPRDPGDQHRTARRRTARGGPPSPATLPCPPRWPALPPADLIPSTFPWTYPPT